MNSETFIDKSCRSIQKNNPTKTVSICVPNPIQYASQVSKKTYYMIYKPISSRLFLKNGIEAFTVLLSKNCPFCNTYSPPLHFLKKLSHLLIPAPLCDKLPALLHVSIALPPFCYITTLPYFIIAFLLILQENFCNY